VDLIHVDCINAALVMLWSGSVADPLLGAALPSTGHTYLQLAPAPTKCNWV